LGLKAFEILKRVLGGKLSKAPAPTGGGGWTMPWILFPFFTPPSLDKFSGIVYSCVDLRAKTVARAKFRIYREIDIDEFEEIEKSHPAVRFFRNLNPMLTRYEFFYKLMAHLDLAGNAYIYFPQFPDGKLREAWLIPPQSVRIVAKNAVELDHYEVYLGGEVIKFKPEEILHLKYPDPNSQFYGKGPLQAILISVEADEFMRIYWKQFFENASVPRLVLEAEPGTSVQTIEKFREDLKLLYSGLQNAGKTPILPPGLKVRPISATPAEMDWIKSRQVTLEEITLAFQVPKTKLGLETGVNRAIAEASDYTFKADVIEPILLMLDESFTKFFSKYFGENIVIKHDSIVPKDREVLLKEYQQFLQWGVISQNEIRKAEGYKPYPGGDTLWMPVNYAPIGEIQDENIVLDPQTQSKKFEFRDYSKLDIEWRRLSAFAKKWENKFEIQIKKLFREQENYITKQLLAKISKQKRNLDDIVEINLEDWIERFKDLLDDLTYQLLEDAFKRALIQMGKDPANYGFSEDDPLVIEIINQLNSQIRDINETTLKQLNDYLIEALSQYDGSSEKTREIVEKIREYYNSVALQRARAIAMTTVTSGVNAGTQYALEEIGAKYKVWLSQRDNKVRESHRLLDGEKVPIDGAFRVASRKGEVILRFPGDPNAPAEEVVNCRCYIIGTDK
jgi:HK97 family phage portal protein